MNKIKKDQLTNLSQGTKLRLLDGMYEMEVVALGENEQQKPFVTFRMAKDEALDKAILDAQSEQDFAKRKQMYFDLQTKIMDKVPGAYLFNPKIIIYKSKKVQGLVVNSAPPLSEYWSVTKAK